MANPQLALEFPFKQSRDETDFFVAKCNETAFQFVKNWREWASPVAVLTGPPHSGKSHLARIWQTETQAQAFQPGCFNYEALASTSRAKILIDDADALSEQEHALFHLFNLAKEHNWLILLTARHPPGHWQVDLPDLRSRLRSYPTVEILEPDDELLAAVLVKLFHDRQLIVSPDVIPFVLSRLERSVQALLDFAERLDRSALAEHRKVTRAFASSVLRRDPPAHRQPQEFEEKR